MKRIMAIAILLFAMSCSGEREKEKIANETKAIVERYVEAVQAKDVEGMAELLSDDYWGYGPSVSDSINKAGAVDNWKYVVENVYDSVQFLRSVMIAADINDGPHPGHYVSNWVDMRITYKDGRGPVHLHTNAVYRVENDKITLSRTFYNEADVYRQLGYEF